MSGAAEQLDPFDLAHEIKAAMIACTKPQQYFELRIRERHVKTLQRTLAARFAAAYGWSLSDRDFDLVTLQRGKQHAGGDYLRYYRGLPRALFDHPYFFRQQRQAAAIAAHLYNWPEVEPGCRRIAADHDLVFELPDFPSWWNPGATTLVLYRHSAAFDIGTKKSGLEAA